MRLAAGLGMELFVGCILLIVSQHVPGSWRNLWSSMISNSEQVRSMVLAPSQDVKDAKGSKDEDLAFAKEAGFSAAGFRVLKVLAGPRQDGFWETPKLHARMLSVLRLLSQVQRQNTSLRKLTCTRASLILWTRNTFGTFRTWLYLLHFHDTSLESALSRDMGTVEVQEKCAAKEKAWEQRQQTRADETQASREGCGLRYPPAF